MSLYHKPPAARCPVTADGLAAEARQRFEQILAFCRQRDYPFAIQNFISLVGEAMGMTRQDLYKRMVLYRDMERVLAEAAPYIAANNVDTGLVQLALPKEIWS